MLSKEYNPEVLQLPSWVTPIFDTVWLLSLQALDVRTKSCIADAPSRPVRTNVSCAANPDGAPPDVSRNASWLVSPPLRVNICRAATHRRPCMRSISNGSFQLHHGRRCRPPVAVRAHKPRGFCFRLGPGHELGVAVRTLRTLFASSPRRWTRPHRGLPALGGPLLGHAAAGVGDLPVCRRRSQALRVQHGHARAWWS
jgi:hypothetical protein